MEKAEQSELNTEKDEFLSEEDLDLRNLSRDELIAQWNAWLIQAQVTNERDAAEYCHGVFMDIDSEF